MRVALAVLCLVAAGCTCGELERGRYQCDPTRDGGAGQCPGASRCGLEGYCHNAGDVSVAWRCTDRNHCENGYECVLADSRAFRECRDPEVEDAGFACAAGADCVRGWHCGAEGVCYDRATAKAVVCARDAGRVDCADGWRCGLDDVCHDTQVPGPYLCADDRDCEGTWRCGLDGACLDPARDALRPTPTTLGAFEKVSPLLLDHPPEHLAVSPVQSPGVNQPRQFLAYADRGDIHVLDLSVGGVPPVGTNPHRIQSMPDAGSIVALATLGAISLDALGAPQIGSWSYVARPDGRFEELHFRTSVSPGFNGTPWRDVVETFNFAPVSNSFSPSWLRIGTAQPGFVPTLTAMPRGQVTGFGRFFFGWGARSRAYFASSPLDYYADVATLGASFAFTGNALLDHATVTGHYVKTSGVVGQVDCVLVADSRGLFVKQLRLDEPVVSVGFPQPVVVPPFTNQSCAGDTGVPQSHRITGLTTSGRDWVALSAHPMVGGVENTSESQVALLDVSSWWAVDTDPNFVFTPYKGCALVDSAARCKKAGTAIDPLFPVSATTSLGPCQVCAGERLVMTAPVPNPQGGMKLEVRCRADATDGGPAVDQLLDVASAPGQGASCFRTPLTLPSPLGTDPVVVSSSNAGQHAFAGPRGHLWLGASSASAFPVFLDQPPVAAFMGPNDAPAFFGPGHVSWAAAPFGLLSFKLNAQDGDRPATAVAGSPKQIVTAGGTVVTFDNVALGQLPRVVAARDPFASRFDPPYHAVHTGASVVVSAGDSVFAARIDQPGAVLRRRIIPAEGKEILGLVHLPTAGPLTVFALTRSAVYRVTAVTEQQWTTEAAPLPAGEPIAVWADGARGRVGYADGRVFGLESRVQIGAALPAPVDAFGQACGSAYALAGGALHRLTPGTSAIGTWMPVDLGGALPAEELAQGGLVSFGEPDGGTSLYLFSRRGETVRAPVACQ